MALFNKMQDIVTILRFNESHAVYIKTVKVSDQIKEFVKKNPHPNYNILRNYKFWIYDKDKSNTNYLIKVNNKGDLMIRIDDSTEEET
jgi:hypothetical protein